MHLPIQFARFRPRLLSSMAGYTRERFFKDAGAGLTVGIVALPLAMAFAIASGLKPEAGIWTAIIAGAIIFVSPAIIEDIESSVAKSGESLVTNSELLSEVANSVKSGLYDSRV